jgi:multisubunit Na+/H+ antiporter MnhG subunit
MGVVLFIFISTPTSSHALMRAAFEDDEMPMTEEDLKKSKKKRKRK